MKHLKQVKLHKFYRICAGSYKIYSKYDTVYIDKYNNEHTKGWIVQASWDAAKTSDPVSTYKEAKEIAIKFLSEA